MEPQTASIYRPVANRSRSQEPRDPAPRGAYGSRGLAFIAAVWTVLVGIGVLAYGWRTGRPDDFAGGVAILLFGCYLVVWSTTASSPAVATFASVGGFVQIAAALYYYYSGAALDAARYHGDALAILRGGPRFDSSSTEWGTDMMAFLVAGLYQITAPSMLLGFVVFALIALIGRVVLARALLLLSPTVGPVSIVAAWLVMLLPSLTLWLGAISKESFAVLGIGLVLAALLRPARSPNYLLIATGLAAVSLTRPHFTVLLAFSLIVYTVVFRQVGEQSFARRMALMIVAGAFGLLSLNLAANFLGVEASISGLEDAREDVSTTFDEGGSNIEQEPIRGVADIPRGVATVLLRPHLFEAQTKLQMAQAVESTLLAGFALWLLFQRGRRQRRPLSGAAGSQIRAVRAFALTYLAGFVYAYSGVYNLGLMSRQRVQVALPLLVLAATALVRVARRSDRATTSGPHRSPPLLLVLPAEAKHQLTDGNRSAHSTESSHDPHAAD